MFREARPSRDQTPAPGWTEGWAPSAPGRPAAPGPQLSPSLSPHLPGCQGAGEMAWSPSLRGTAESWLADLWSRWRSADLCRHSRPPTHNRSTDYWGPFLGFLSQASGKLAFLGSRLGSRPGLQAGRMLWKMHTRAEGVGAGHLGGGGPGGGNQGLSGLTAPSPCCHAGRACAD